MSGLMDYMGGSQVQPDPNQPQQLTLQQLLAMLGSPDLSQSPAAAPQPTLAGAPQPSPAPPMPAPPTQQVPQMAPLQAPPSPDVQAPQQMGILDHIKAAMGNPNAARVLLSAGAAMMDAGGPHLQQTSFGQALARGMDAGGQAYDQGNALDMQKKLQQQTLGASQWTTLTPAQAKAEGLQELPPGYMWQKNGNGEEKPVGENAIKEGTDPNTGLPTLLDTRHLPASGSGAAGANSKIDATVDLVGKYQEPLATALARTPWAIRGLVQQQLAAKYPGYHAENYSMYNKGYKDFGTGQQGNTVRSMNVGISHLDTLGQLADALHNSDIPLINKVSNFWKTQTGQAAPTNFDAAKNVVAQELVKAITGYPGAASDREAASAEIKNDSSPAMLKGTIDTYQRLLAGQLMGLKGQYQHSTGRDDFENEMRLNPEVIQKLEGNDAGSPAPPAAIPAGWGVVAHQ